MSREKLRRVLALLHDEAKTPSSRSREIIAALREIASVYEREITGPRAIEPGVLHALERMHAALAERWTVATLARIAGMSRAVFARKFAAAFGVPPLEHLREERMHHAATRLAETAESLAEIAQRVGFHSEWAFSRAFKRHHGVAPGSYRRRTALTGAAQFRPRMAMAA